MSSMERKYVFLTNGAGITQSSQQRKESNRCGIHSGFEMEQTESYMRHETTKRDIDKSLFLDILSCLSLVV